MTPDTPQELGRTLDEAVRERIDDEIDHEIEEHDEPTQSHRTEEWLDSFETQLTEQMIDRVRKFARPRALGVAWAGRKVDDYYVHELVQDAIGDTWLGRLTWDPSRVTLENHLLRVVQCRTRHHKNHAKEFPHEAIGDATDRSKHAESAASSWVAGDAPHSETALYSQQVIEQIRNRLGKDHHAHRVLDALCAGARAKAEILEYARMTSRTYHAAQVRLRRVIRSMTNEQLAPKARA